MHGYIRKFFVLQFSREELLRKAVFATMGIIAILVNLGSKSTLELYNAPLAVSGWLGFVLGGQANFFLHNFVTWRDRHPDSRGLGRRWLWFVLGNWVLGLPVYMTALLMYSAVGLPNLVAFVAALLTGSVSNYLWNDKFSFPHHPLDPTDDSVDNDRP